MESRHLNERERLVIHEGGIIIGREEGREEGFAEGIKKGKEEGKILSAKQLIEHYGLKAEDVAKLLGVQVEGKHARKYVVTQ